jgi:hypothetical protein
MNAVKIIHSIAVRTGLENLGTRTALHPHKCAQKRYVDLTSLDCSTSVESKKELGLEVSSVSPDQPIRLHHLG